MRISEDQSLSSVTDNMVAAGPQSHSPLVFSLSYNSIAQSSRNNGCSDATWPLPEAPMLVMPSKNSPFPRLAQPQKMTDWI